MVIPVFQENFDDLIKVWGNLPKSVLIIIVANSYLTNDSRTTKLFDQFCAQSSIKRLTKNILFLKKSLEKDILLIDRCHHSTIIPRRNGVGLARKIGADIALSLILKKIVLEPKIGVTDADVRLPTTYFEPKMKLADAALIYPFKHFTSNDLNEEILLYELSMLYYSAGVKWSGSPYGFTTIGSLIILNPDHYSQVRGFPKKNAGEDFYIPKGTAYYLKANAFDSDNDNLTYCWEQLDSGQVNASNFGPDLLTGSINRSIPPSENQTRNIPNISQILNGNLVSSNPTLFSSWETV